MVPYEMLFEPRADDGSGIHIEYHRIVSGLKPASGWFEFIDGQVKNSHVSLYEFWRGLVCRKCDYFHESYIGNMTMCEEEFFCKKEVIDEDHRVILE